MNIRNWLFGYAWALLFALNVGVSFDIAYGGAAFSLLAFALTIADAMLTSRSRQ